MAAKSLRISSFLRTGSLEVLTPQISTLVIKKLPPSPVLFMCIKNYLLNRSLLFPQKWYILGRKANTPFDRGGVT
jgi:hypothetical protein